MKFKGENPKTGELTIYQDGTIEMAIHNGSYCVTKSKSKTELKIEKKKVSECVVVESSKVGVEVVKNEVYRGSKEPLESLIKVSGEDGSDLTGQVTIEVVTDTYNNDEEGEYEVKYIITDLEGMMKTVTETIRVIPLVLTYEYTGASQTFTVPYDGVYQIELWGASGFGGRGNHRGGFGSYVSGEIQFYKDNTLYLYVGEEGITAELSRPYGQLSFNGASGGNYTCYNYFAGKGAYNFYGGSGTDLRLVEGAWDNTIGLRSRIMVASGGAAGTDIGDGTNAGGLRGYDGPSGTGGTQVSGGGPNAGSFGKAGVPIYLGNLCDKSDRWGAGSGYYGGGASNVGGSNLTARYSAGSGSSYISGHIGCVAITSETDQTPKVGCTTGTSDSNCSIHYSNYQFSNTVMIDGAGYRWTNQKEGQQTIPNPEGGEYPLGTGHLGNGVARVTLLHT